MRKKLLFLLSLFFGVATGVWAQSAPDNLQTDTDGNYLVGSVGQWKLLGELVGQATDPVNVKMTADIDLGEDQTIIGSSDKAYTGTFDGQGHTLTVAYDSEVDYTAPFRNIKNATIKNLHVAGTINTTGWYAAGIVAGAHSGTNYINNCISSIDITGNYVGGNQVDWHGGVAGEVTGSGTKLYINDCLFMGSITGSGTTNSYCANMVGIVRTYNGVSFTNCLSTATASNVQQFNSLYHYINGSASSITNCYVLQGYTTTQYGQAGQQTTEEALASGTVTTALQASRTDDIWMQATGLAMPIPAAFAGSLHNLTIAPVPNGDLTVKVGSKDMTNNIDGGGLLAGILTGLKVTFTPCQNSFIISSISGTAGEKELNITLNDDKTEALLAMPANDGTVNYELKLASYLTFKPATVEHMTVKVGDNDETANIDAKGKLIVDGGSTITLTPANDYKLNAVVLGDESNTGVLPTNYTGTETWFGTSYANQFMWAVMFSPSKFSANYLTGIRIAARGENLDHPITVKVYSGGDNPIGGELLYTQDHYPTVAQEFETMNFDQAVLIDQTKPLWFVFSQEEKYPAYAGKYPEDTDAKIWTYNPNSTYPQWSSNEDYTCKVYAIFNSAVAVASDGSASFTVPAGNAVVNYELEHIPCLTFNPATIEHMTVKVGDQDVTANIDANGKLTGVTKNSVVTLTAAKSYKFNSANCLTSDGAAVINYDLYDSYGDGWNGGSIQIKKHDSGEIIATLTLESGSSKSGSIEVISGTYDIIYTAGSYSDENYFTLTDGEGNEILTKAQGTTGNIQISYTATGTSTAIDVDFKDGKTVASFTMPAGDAIVNYEVAKFYEVTVPAGEYMTYFRWDEALTTDDDDAQLYTITDFGEGTAIATEISVAHASMPILIWNNSSVEKTFVLYQTKATPDDVWPVSEFRGYDEPLDLTIGEEQEYYICNGKQFVRVYQDGTIAAHRCWLRFGDAPKASKMDIVVGKRKGIIASEGATYELAKGDNEYGEMTFFVNGEEVSTAKVGDEVTVKITCDEAWMPNLVMVEPYSTFEAAKAPRRASSETEISMLQPFEASKVNDLEWTFLMCNANALVNISYVLAEDIYTIEGSIFPGTEEENKMTKIDATGLFLKVYEQKQLHRGSYPFQISFNGSDEIYYGVVNIPETGTYDIAIVYDPVLNRISVNAVMSGTTGIDGMTIDDLVNGAIYNLSGQRVTTPRKGLYIINGKKVVRP